MRKIPYGKTAATVALCAALAPMAAYATEPAQSSDVGSDSTSTMEQPVADQPAPLSLEKNRPQHSTVKESDVDNLNYFINLAGDVLDSEAGAGHHAASDFTGALTPEYKVDGDVLEAATNASPMESDIVEDYGKTTWIYDAVMGEDPDDYVAADAEIRKILSAKGLLPTDETVLAEAKRQVESGATIKDISGETVSSSLISTAYYKVYWYVLKEGGEDYWHVDGIMKKLEQPKVQTYTVEYQWTNAPDGQVLPKTVTYAENDPVTVDTTYAANMEVAVEGGKWVFSGWNKSGTFNITSNTVISGSWEFIEDEVQQFEISYGWNGDVPPSKTYPASAIIDEGDSYTVDTTYYAGMTIEYDYGTYTFSGWDHTGIIINVSENIMIRGTWSFAPKQIEIEKVWLSYAWNGEAPDTALYPIPEQYDKGETAKITDAYSTHKDLVDSKGVKWTFKGWDRTGEFKIEADTIVYGTWERVIEVVPPAEEKQEFDVTYEWDGDVPADAVLPEKKTYEEDTVVPIDKTYDENTVIETENGKYYFSGWDKDDEFAVNEDTVIRGTWTFIENEKVVPPADEEQVPPADEEEVPPAEEATPPVEESVPTTKDNAAAKPVIPQTGDNTPLAIALFGGFAAAIMALGSRFKMRIA